MTPPSSRARVSTGIDGLDAILQGGLPQGRTVLLQGQPGAGKTTIGLHFLVDGRRRGERTLFITLSQTEAELADIAASHGWSLDGIEVAELSRRSVTERLAAQQSIFRTADIELGETTRALRDAVEEYTPHRIVFDSVGAVRVMAGGPGTRYWEEMVLLQQFLQEQGATVLLIDDIAGAVPEVESQAMAHGVIELTYDEAGYGSDRRRLRVSKMRGQGYHGGLHHFAIRTGGVEVFPRLQKPDAGPVDWDMLPSGVEAFDRMLGGGLHSGTSCLFIGTAGTGKTALTTCFLHTALREGKRAALFLFEEHPEMYIRRAELLGLGLRDYADSGALATQSIDTGEISPGEFAHQLKRAVDDGAELIVIDSLTGYFRAMPHGRVLIAQMHEMLRYLRRRGVLSLITVAQHGLIGPGTETGAEVSYIADTIVLLRYYEVEGAVHKAVSVLKKRYGAHEHTVRSLEISDAGVTVGAPVTSVRGVLSGYLVEDDPEGDVAGGGDGFPSRRDPSAPPQQA